mgnify:CR=1 FL=1
MLSSQVYSALENSQVMLDLIKKFEPLLKKYGRKLEMEDGYEEMQLEFIELIHKLNAKPHLNLTEGAMVNYIVSSIKNSFYKLSRERKKQLQPSISFDELTDKSKYQLISENKTLPIIILSRTLSTREILILRLCFEYGYTSAEIARHFNVTRQNINQIKKRALKKLKSSID